MINKISLSNLASEMTKGIVKFSYLKKDGTFRLAYGTRNERYFSENNVIVGDKKSPNSVFTYWDTEVNGWRSLSRAVNEEVVHFDTQVI